MITSWFDQARRVYQYHRSKHERRFRQEVVAGRPLKMEEVAAVLTNSGSAAAIT